MARLEHTWDEVDKVISAVRGDSDSGTHPVSFSTENTNPDGSEVIPLFGASADFAKLDTIKTFVEPDEITIKSLYESNPNTNAFDDDAVAKLDGIEDSADVTTEASVRSAGATMNDDDDLSGVGWFLNEGTLASNSPTKAPSQRSVKTYVDNVVSGGVTYIGPYDALNNIPDLDVNPSGITRADMYVVETGGDFFTLPVDVGTTLIADQDNPVTLEHWTVLQSELGAVEIKTLYESNADTNEFDDAEKAKLTAIDPGRLSEDLYMDGFSIFARPLGDDDGGVILPLVDGAAFAYATDLGYQPNDGSVVVRAGQVELRGTTAHVISLESSATRQVRVTSGGILFGVDLPDPGWVESDTSIADVDLGSGEAPGAWIEVSSLSIVVPEDIIVGDSVHTFISVYVENKSDKRGGELNIGYGVSGAQPTSEATVSISPAFSGQIPVNLTSVTIAALAGETVSAWVRKGDGEHAQFGLDLLGTTEAHTIIVSKDAPGGGGGGDVSKVGTPAIDQIPIWVGDGPIKGSENLKFLLDKTLAVNDGKIIVHTINHNDWGIQVGNNLYSSDPEVGFKMMVANTGVAQFHYRGDAEFQRIDFELYDGVDRVPGLEIWSTHLKVPGDIELVGDYRGDVTPDGDAARSMGAAEQRWLNVYAQNVLSGINEGDEVVFGAQDLTQGDVTRYFVMTAGLEPSADLHDTVTINTERILRDSDLGVTIQRQNANLADKTAANAWTKTQHSPPLVLVDDGTEDAIIEWDLENGQMAHVIITGTGRTINPTNLAEGALYTLGVEQGAPGGHSIGVWNNTVWAGGVPQQSDEEGAIDWYSFTAKGGVLHGFDPGGVPENIKTQGRESIWIPATEMRPTVADGCAALADISTGADTPDVSVLEFGFAANEHAQFSVAFPRSWDSGVLNFIAAWTSGSPDAGSVSFALQAVEVDHKAAIGQSYGAPVTLTRANSAGPTDMIITGESDDITVAHLGEDRGNVFFRIYRDALSAPDTLQAGARLLGIHLYYESDKPNDDGQAGGIDLSEDMVAWWSMDEASGVRADSHINGYDLSPNGNVGTEVGHIGNATTFTGEHGTNLTRANAPELWQLGLTDKTIAMWIKPYGTKSGQPQILIGSGGMEAGRVGWTVKLALTNQIRVWVSDNTERISLSINSLPNMPEGEWSLVLVEIDRSSNMRVWYNNVKAGNESADITFIQGIDIQNTYPLMVAQRASKTDANRAGSVPTDVTVIWNRLLTEEEKTLLYNDGAGLTYAEATGG